jgi:hypothetical protein
MPCKRDSLPKKSPRFSKATDAGLKELAGLTNSSALAHHARSLRAMRVMAMSDSANQMAGISIVASNHHVKWYACRGPPQLFQSYERCARRSLRPTLRSRDRQRASGRHADAPFEVAFDPMEVRSGSLWRTVFVSEQLSPSTHARAHASGLGDQFTDKLVSHYQEGDVTSAVVLVKNSTETGWFQRLTALASAVCFPTGRARFLDPQGNPCGAPLQGQALLYLGPDVSAFVRVCSRFGFCRPREDS